MLRFYIALILILFFFNTLSAQTIKTKVLVVGGGASGTGAAIQAAHSGVETLLVEETGLLGIDMRPIDTTNTVGLDTEFIKRYKALQKFSGSKTETALTPNVLKAWTDTVKNLSVLVSTSIQQIEKSGKGWTIRLTNGRKVKADVVVDATANGNVAMKAGAERTNTGVFKTIIPNIPLDQDQFYKKTLYRTGVVTANTNNENQTVPLASFVSANQENLILNGSKTSFTLQSGQAPGATAAYCAFFKTTTKNINIRMIQGELLAYKSLLLPFVDIKSSDSSFTAIQHIAATGILKANIKENKLYFMPDSSISSDEIRQPMKEFYSRSQIWFADNKLDKLTLKDVLSLIKFSGNRGEELNREVERGWTNTFRFKGKFDPNKVATRQELAVLINNYLKPFNVRIDVMGKLLY